ncbi:MAG: DUF3604 domain-containing protein [Deltaproteobacteria bacterium]|nr:DUF3604 domain-containing protein [Deltaproteobacteria bacterium]
MGRTRSIGRRPGWTAGPAHGHARAGVAAFVAASAALSVATVSLARADDALPQLFFGDLHLHTSNSLDANLFNNFTLGPDVAYRFAKGEAVQLPDRRRAKLDRPLDFLMVSDHAEYLGVFSMIRRKDPRVAGSETATKVSRFIAENPVFGPEQIGKLTSLLVGDPLGADPALRRAVWDEVVDVAEQMYEPGRFTTFVGYEWGSMPNGNNLHRNVIFRDGADRAKKILPFSAIDSGEPEALWKFLARYERETGGQAFAIPHNSNLSNGLMFATVDSAGKPIDATYARARARYEPVVEVTQIKGDSETHPFLSPDDEFADYERWDKTNIAGTARTLPEMHVGSYARAALKTGLLLERLIGVNPYRFAMIGSTDSHTSLATADEKNYWGKTANMHLGTDRSKGEFIHSSDPAGQATMNWEQAAAGYVGVWAGANTREAIFDALRRGETYSTTGPRIAVLFFGGWRFGDVDAGSSNVARAGYVKGVPMGSDLPAPIADQKTPTFLLSVAKDPVGANLERIQIVKGWVDAAGRAQEKVFDVERAPDVKGLREISAVWTDPDFDGAQPAFYYARVLEVATPRWNAIDATRFRRKLEPGTRVTQQERAYTSPIWYRPPAAAAGAARAAEPGSGKPAQASSAGQNAD